MALPHHVRHKTWHYPVSAGQRIYSIILMPVLTLVLIYLAFSLFSVTPFVVTRQLPFDFYALALLATLARLVVAYVLALVVAIPLAVFITRNATAERILFPLFDIIQSVPVLAFFPVIIWVFIKFNFFDGAAIFLLFLTMLWNIVFSLVSGINVIPVDIKSVAQTFKIKGTDYFRFILLPAIFPHLLTGSLLAWAQGWNVIIVAEVLHNYLPNNQQVGDLFGIGNLLVHASTEGSTSELLSLLAVLVAAIAFLNYFVWQKLLHYAERYKFD